MTRDTLNYHRGNPESRAAKELSRRNAERDRTRILRLAGIRGGVGVTCDEVERLLGLSHQTCSARFSELKRDKLLVPTQLRRPTRSGAQARVMIIAWPVRAGSFCRLARGYTGRIGQFGAAATGTTTLEVVDPTDDLALPALPVPVPLSGRAAGIDVGDNHTAAVNRLAAMRAWIVHVFDLIGLTGVVKARSSDQPRFNLWETGP
jgi:hypothetical protein